MMSYGMSFSLFQPQIGCVRLFDQASIQAYLYQNLERQEVLKLVICYSLSICVKAYVR